jgi:tetratricopeptide (TPR) repeat protein
VKLLTAFLGRRREQRTMKLYGEGREFIDSFDHERALKIGRKLRKLRYSGAFEIEALAYSGLDREEDAVRVLREGLELAPQAWPNWILLGSCLSNLHQYDEALVAYDRARACEGADLTSIDFNRAILAWRRKEFAEALRLLDTLPPAEREEFRLRVISLRVEVLHALGRDAEAEALAVATLNEVESDEEPREIGKIAAVLTALRRKRGDGRAQLCADAIRWWRRERHSALLSEIRELHSARSPAAQYFRLVIGGVISESSPLREDADGFFVKVDAVADSPEEALAYYRELEDVEAAFSIDESEVIQPAPNDPKGVCWMSGRVFHERE